MQGLERDLFNFTGKELHEVAWIANLPINHGVILNSFFEAFRDYGKIKLSLDDKARTAEFKLPLKVGNNEKIFGTHLYYDKILEGWKKHFKASPQALYDSIHQVYNQLEDRIYLLDKSFYYSEEIKWQSLRNKSCMSTRRIMESHLLGYFKKYHEGILLSVKENGNDGEFHEPEIFNEVIEDFPMDKLRKVIIAREIHKEHTHVGPCAEYVLETPEEAFSEDIDEDGYYPSEASLMDVFWGMYLQKLSTKKGYPAHGNNYSLRHFIANGNRALEHLQAGKDYLKTRL